jgi:hypothetical protein
MKKAHFYLAGEFTLLSPSCPLALSHERSRPPDFLPHPSNGPETLRQGSAVRALKEYFLMPVGKTQENQIPGCPFARQRPS